jgi:hypothetical protein
LRAGLWEKKMRVMSGRELFVSFGTCAVLLLTAPPALAQTASPSPDAPTVEGEVTGALAKGSTLDFTVDAAMSGGWEALHLVEIVLRSGDQELERMRYDIEDVQLTMGDQPIVVGTGGVATGEYLRVSGADVIVTQGGANFSFKVAADVIKTLPEDTAFQLGVVDDLLTQTTVTVSLAEPPPEGLTWSTVVAAVLIALLAGGTVGNLFASKRRAPARFSVYGTIDRRLRSERESSSQG